MTDAPYSPYIDRLGIDWDASNDDDMEVAAALDLTLTNLTSYIAAAAYVDADEHVIEGWDDLCYEQLLSALSPSQLAKAVIALVTPYAAGQADGLVNQFRDLREVAQ